MFQQAKQITKFLPAGAKIAVYDRKTKQTLYVAKKPKRLGFLWEYTPNKDEAKGFTAFDQEEFVQHMLHSPKLIEFQEA